MEFVTSVNSTDVIPLNSTVFPLETWNGNDSSYADEYTTHIYELYNVTNSTNSTHKRRRNVSKYYPIIVAEMIASCLCLMFSIAVYALLPEFRNVNGKNLITLSSCLLTTFLMLILDLIIRNYVPFGVCFTIAMIIHVTFLGTFFWTNVMAFDIWKTLTEMKSKGEVKKHSKKYLKYSIYAWTATTLTALPAALFEATDWVPGAYRPKFGVVRCWLSDTTAFIYYFNLPVGIILACNLVMFILIIRKLRIIKKMTAILNVKQQQERTNLYFKLFLVMGITWSTEFLPWVTGIYGLYALAGMLTALHGCFLFFIFVCKKRILTTFFHRIRHGEKLSSSTPNTSNTQPTLSSNSNQKQSMEHLADSKC